MVSQPQPLQRVGEQRQLCCQEYVCALEKKFSTLSGKISGMVEEASQQRKAAQSLVGRNDRLKAICAELEARSVDLSSSNVQMESLEHKKRKELSEQCQGQIAELSEQVDAADELRRSGLEHNAALRRELQELLADFEARQADHGKSTEPQAQRVAQLKEKHAAMEMEAADISARAVAAAESIAAFDVEQERLQERLHTASEGFTFADEARDIHTRLAEHRSLHQCSLERAAALEKEQAGLQQQCTGLAAAVSRIKAQRETIKALRAEQVELEATARLLHGQQKEEKHRGGGGGGGGECGDDFDDQGLASQQEGGYLSTD
jgi:chromosome segregation ATPase